MDEAFTKRFIASTPQRKCTMEARAPFASILKYFSIGAVYEFVTKVYFLSSVTAFAELGYISRCELHHGRQEAGVRPLEF